MTSEWTLNQICNLPGLSASHLNALHACRKGHPLNKTTKTPWLEAWFLLAQRPSYIVPTDALHWLRKQAVNHGETAA